MITYEQAKKIAKNAKSVINECHEYDKAWVFVNKNFDGEGDAGVVVMKENGRTKSFVDFILNDSPDPKFKVVEL